MEWNAYGNAARGDAVRDACEAEELIFTIWMTRSGQPENDFDFTAATARKAIEDSGATGLVAEAEIPGTRPEAQNWQELVWALEDKDIYKGVATNFAPFVKADGSPDRPKAAPLIQDGWSCLTECYLPEAPNSTPENQDFFAKHFTYDAVKALPPEHPDHALFIPGMGWYETQPIAGLYGGFTWADYPTLGSYRNWSVWAAEYLL